MITDAAYRAVVERCLRLEAELRGVAIDPAPVAPPVWRQRAYRPTTEAERATMRALRAIGVSHNEIARRTGYSHQTVRRYTRGER